MKNIRWIGSILLLIVAGCTNTAKMTNSWKAQQTIPQKYNKVMVLGLIREADRSTQMNMEIHLVGDLQEIGIHTISSLQEYGPKAFDLMDEQTALDKLRSSGVDAVITIVLVDKEKEKKYRPGNQFYSAGNNANNTFWGYRTKLYNRICETGYYVASSNYFWESNLYDMRSQKLVYSAQTQSFDPASSSNSGHHYGQMIVKDLVKNNIFKKMAVITTKAL